MSAPNCANRTEGKDAITPVWPGGPAGQRGRFWRVGVGRGLELAAASVSVVAQSCMVADAWSTAMIVFRPEACATLAREQTLTVLFLRREAQTIGPYAVGRVIAVVSSEP